MYPEPPDEDDRDFLWACELAAALRGPRKSLADWRERELPDGEYCSIEDMTDAKRGSRILA